MSIWSLFDESNEEPKQESQTTPEPEFDDCPESPTGKHSESWFGNGEYEQCKTGAQNVPMVATPEQARGVRCEGCGYMTHHREHMGCVRAAKQHTHPAPGVPEGLQWFTVAEHGMPDFDEEVIGGFWYTDPWLKPELATRFMWGLCRVFKDDHRDFKDGKRWFTFGPSHNQITHWARINLPEADSKKSHHE